MEALCIHFVPAGRLRVCVDAVKVNIYCEAVSLFDRPRLRRAAGGPASPTRAYSGQRHLPFFNFRMPESTGGAVSLSRLGEERVRLRQAFVGDVTLESHDGQRRPR